MKCSALSGMSCSTRKYPGPNAIVMPLQGDPGEETDERAQESSMGFLRLSKI